MALTAQYYREQAEKAERAERMIAEAKQAAGPLIPEEAEWSEHVAYADLTCSWKVATMEEAMQRLPQLPPREKVYRCQDGSTLSFEPESGKKPAFDDAPALIHEAYIRVRKDYRSPTTINILTCFCRIGEHLVCVEQVVTNSPCEIHHHVTRYNRNTGEPVAKHDELRWRQAPPEGMNRIQTWWAPLGSAQERTLYGWHPDNLVDDHNVQCSKLRRYPINEQEGELLCRATFMKYHRDEAEKWGSLPIYEPK